jgi:hypothetical protein
VRPGHYTIGQVKLDQAKGTVTFPATVNLREGAIEYLVVTDYGKIHESLLRTSVTPHHLQLALLLLGLEPRGTNAFVIPKLSPRARTGGLTVDVAWTTKGRVRRTAAGDHVRNLRLRQTIGRGRWVFAGSRFREDGFAAQSDGSIITVIDDPDAIIASALPGSDDDDNWLAAGRRLPPMDSPVEVILTIRR